MGNQLIPGLNLHGIGPKKKKKGDRKNSSPQSIGGPELEKGGHPLAGSGAREGRKENLPSEKFLAPFRAQILQQPQGPSVGIDGEKTSPLRRLSGETGRSKSRWCIAKKGGKGGGVAKT